MRVDFYAKGSDQKIVTLNLDVLPTVGSNYYLHQCRMTVPKYRKHKYKVLQVDWSTSYGSMLAGPDPAPETHVEIHLEEA